MLSRSLIVCCCRGDLNFHAAYSNFHAHYEIIFITFIRVQAYFNFFSSSFSVIRTF